MRHWLIIAAIFAAIALTIGLSAVPAPTGLAAASAPADVCPVVPNTPFFALANGEVWLDGAEAPVGTIVAALSPRGEVVGCTEVSDAGHYGAMYIYGEDTSASPFIPGMKAGETVSFRVNGLLATASPALVWHNDWATTHSVTLTASTPSATPDADEHPRRRQPARPDRQKHPGRARRAGRRPGAGGHGDAEEPGHGCGRRAVLQRRVCRSRSDWLR